MDKNGNLITKYIYDEILPFCGKYVIVKKEDYYGILNFKGKIIEDFKFSSIQFLADGYSLCFDNQCFELFFDGKLKR